MTENQAFHESVIGISELWILSLTSTLMFMTLLMIYDII